MIQPTGSTRKNQQGVASLMVALMVLISLTLLTFMAAKVSVTEHKISANEYRSKQAFEAAQAGIEYGIRALQNNTTTIIVDADGNNVIDPYTPNAEQGTTGTLSNNSAYSVAMAFNTAFNTSPKRITLTSTGTADDGTGTRMVTQLVLATPVLLNPPPAPVISRQNINITGNTTVTNPTGNVSVMSGAITSSGGSASITATGPVPTGCTADGRCNEQPDLQITGDAFFQKFFGISKTQYQQAATTVTSLADLSTQYAAGARVFWFEGDLQANGGIYGTGNAPIILVVRGNIRINGGGTTFNGLIYGTGVYESGGGSSTVNGAVVVEDDVTTNNSQLAGTATFTYNQALLTTLQNSNLSFAKVTGGWRDF